MRLRTIGRALLRRWHVALGGLLAVGGLCYYLNGAVPVDYKSTGSVVLLPSADAVGAGGNPYLFLNGLGQAMDVLTRRLSAPETSDQLTAGHRGTTYTAVPDVTSGSSILVVTVKSRSGAEASSVMQSILEDVPKELTAMQDQLKVPSPSRISSMKVAETTAPVADTKARIQAVAAAGAAGALVVILLTALLDGLLVRLERRRSVRAAERRARELEEGERELSSELDEALDEKHGPKLVPVPTPEPETEPEPEAGSLPPRRQWRAFGDRS
ncbi:MAG: hypothetical protein HOQ07_05570 [Sinomonas sp.]|nr:hypothetical protein [Sinomonas sp.]